MTDKYVQILTELGFELDAVQPHVTGERHVMKAATTASGKKVVLLGTRIKDGMRVVIKIADDVEGIHEIEHERICRQILPTISFAYGTFLTPEEILYVKKDTYSIFVQRFIETSSQFIDRPLLEQFDIALRAFKMQESAHATTYGHAKLAQTFGSVDASYYLTSFDSFKKDLLAHTPDPRLPKLLNGAAETLALGAKTIEQYSGFLTHVDFVPHNIRVTGNEIYLLDASSLRFGNKYEGWARFLNFMTLYNPELEEALVSYIKLNRTPEESEALYLMRVFRLTEIIWYYADVCSRCNGDLQALNQERVSFWTSVLDAVLHKEKLSPEVREEYQQKRNSLRSPEEKQRQKNLH